MCSSILEAKKQSNREHLDTTPINLNSFNRNLRSKFSELKAKLWDFLKHRPTFSLPCPGKFLKWNKKPAYYTVHFYYLQGWSKKRVTDFNSKCKGRRNRGAKGETAPPRFWHILNTSYFIHRFQPQNVIYSQEYNFWPKNDGEK